MKTEIDWDSVFADLPRIMGLQGLKMRGRVWYGPYRIDGSPHHRPDKMAIKQGLKDHMPIILEQGGDSCTLWSWLVTYGRMTNSQVRAHLLGVEKVTLVFPDQEYSGPTRYVEPWKMIEQGGASRKWYNPLFFYLTKFYPVRGVVDAFRRYNVSDGLKHRESGVIGTRFWFLSKDRRICHDKTMFYGDDGHRLKDCPPMRMFKRKNGYTADCFFGEDSIVPGRPVFVVESEKTAIICWLEYPDYNWVASAGKNCLNDLDRLSGNEIYLVPDVDAIEEWKRYGKVWDWWRRCGVNVQQKWDIGDFILEKHIKRISL